MKRTRSTAWALMTPAITLVAAVLIYPSLRAIAVSFYRVSSLTAPYESWRFVGLRNYIDLFAVRLYRQSLINIAEIWLLSAVFTIVIAFLLASA
ncbi:MAG: sugar ABC transporter permease, partial [Rhizobiaceae bacterium]|nr:sugar ABC transporter permease [Rhizobiaceae bacterium]